MRKTNLAVGFSMLALSTVLILLSSCSKDPLQPSAAAASSSSTTQASMQAEQTALTSAAYLSPGLYKVEKFIEKGKDETAQFYGYTFKFQADGVLVATTRSGQVVKGKWRLNSTGTKLLIDISGTEGLNDVDDDNWKVEALTASNIKISLPDPVLLVFVKIQ